MLLRAARQLQRYPLADLVSRHRIDYTVAANWKVILENYRCAARPRRAPRA
jgi:hypothetical protein